MPITLGHTWTCHVHCRPSGTGCLLHCLSALQGTWGWGKQRRQTCRLRWFSLHTNCHLGWCPFTKTKYALGSLWSRTSSSLSDCIPVKKKKKKKKKGCQTGWLSRTQVGRHVVKDMCKRSVRGQGGVSFPQINHAVTLDLSVIVQSLSLLQPRWLSFRTCAVIIKWDKLVSLALYGALNVLKYILCHYNNFSALKFQRCNDDVPHKN